MITYDDIDDRDLFTWEGDARIRKQVADDIANDGVERTYFERHFAIAEMYRKILEAAPTYRERQAVREVKVSASCMLTEEEMAYLADMLEGVNHPVGQIILGKVSP